MSSRVTLPLTLETGGEQISLEAGIDDLVIAGWTGRNRDAMEAHVAELEAIGIARPARMPTYYRVGCANLTTAEEIEVPGITSSGEVEFVVLPSAHGLLVGLGSDHTDREVEKAGVTISKQLCQKPICPVVWKHDDVAAHWDELVLRSWAVEGGERALYQEGPVTTMRDPLDLMADYKGAAAEDQALTPGFAMFCGTLAVHGGVRHSEAFEIELEDPVLARRLHHVYRIRELPIEG